MINIIDKKEDKAPKWMLWVRLKRNPQHPNLLGLNGTTQNTH